VISGRPYRAGERLRDKADHEIPVEVDSIVGKKVVLVAVEDTGRPTVTLDLDSVPDDKDAGR
jgi:hypothetical protein